MPGEERAQRTYRYEKWRAVAHGVLEAAGTTFLLLIAVRQLHAGATAKALVAGGGSLGLLLSPWVVTWVEAAGWPTAQAVARLSAIGAGCFVVMALLPAEPVFVLGSMLSMAAASAGIPLMTQIYQENYPPHRRGFLFSRTVMIRIGVAALFSQLAGGALSGHMDQYRLLLVVFSAAFGFSSYALSRYPSRPLAVSGGKHPFRALRFARSDRVFRQTLIAWMLMGFANLMMLPLRIEFLANPKYGLRLTIEEIAFLVGVLPNLVRLTLSPIWGWLFDRTNFFVLRVTLNLGFAAAILSFFTSDSMVGLILGAMIYGASNSGGDVAWGLWVTKVAPPERVADYMSVHTFFTGVRGVCAPLTAFYLATQFPLSALGWFSAGLIGLASLLLIPEIQVGRKARPSTALTEEISE